MAVCGRYSVNCGIKWVDKFDKTCDTMSLKVNVRKRKKFIFNRKNKVSVMKVKINEDK